MRLVPAAVQLTDDLHAIDDSIEVEPHGDPDGFGVTRSVAFDAEPYVVDALRALPDERIEEVYTRKNRVFVRFVPTSAADFKDPFLLAAQKPEPKKRAAKKSPKS